MHQASTTQRCLFASLFLLAQHALSSCAMQFGAVHTAVLGGPLHLTDSSIRAAQATIYYKAIPAEIPSLYRMRAVMFLTDPLQEHHAFFRNSDDQPTNVWYENHLGPDWQQHITQPPSLRLQPLKHHNQADSTNISLPHVIPHAPSDISQVLDAPTQRYSYQRGLLKGHGPLQYELKELNGTVVESHYGGQWALCVADWWQCARVPAAMLLGTRDDHRVAQPSYWLVFKPLFAASIDAAAARLFAVLTHHIQLGFAGALLYDNGGCEAALRAHPLLTAFLDKGQLRIVQWGAAQGGTVVPASNSQGDAYPEWTTYDQPMVYTHASMAAWGSNSYLLFSDVDEFLVLPHTQPDPGSNSQHPVSSNPTYTTIQQATCLSSTSYAQVQRINMLCPTSARELQHEPMGAADIVRRYAQCTLMRKGDWPWEDWPKVFAKADAIAGMGIHDGVVFPQDGGSGGEDTVDKDTQGMYVAPLDRSCAWLVHLHNLAFTRHTEDAVFEEDPSWTAPLVRALEDMEGDVDKVGGGDNQSAAATHHRRQSRAH